MIVFLDVDGVLANWNAGVFERLGLNYDYNDWPFAKGRDGWDWNKELGLSFETISDLCDFDLWANLPWLHDGKKIYEDVKRVFGQHNIRLLTTPMPNVMSASGKMEWIYRNLPELRGQVIISTAPKDTIATVPGSYLIDDSSTNVDRWRGAGGRAILVPRWWNDDHPLALMSADIVAGRLDVLQRYPQGVRHG
jgi:5'(3')-deoxyribonucleotidase